MEFRFFKLHTGGNDYILIDASRQKVPERDQRGALAHRLCNRHTGIGGSGLILLSWSPGEAPEAEVWTSRGKEAPLMGDPVLILCRYLFDNGLVNDHEITIRWKKEHYKARIIDSAHFRLTLPPPETPGGSPLIEKANADYNATLLVHGQKRVFTPVQVLRSSPVFFMDIHDKERLRETAEAAWRGLSGTRGWEKHFNPLFASVSSRQELRLTVPCRKAAANNIDACAAAAVAAVLNGFTEREVRIERPSGEYYFQWNEKTSRIYLTGSAGYLFSGEYAAAVEAPSP